MSKVLKKKILLFTDWYEPGFKAGGPIRSCLNFVKSMRQEYDIYVFTRNMDLGDQIGYIGIEYDRWVWKDSVHVFYASPSKLGWKSILSEIKSLVPDYLYVSGMYSRYFSVYPLIMRRFGFVDSRMVLAPRGMLRSSAIAYKYLKKATFLRILKIIRAFRGVVVHATDEVERGDVEKWLGGGVESRVIENFTVVPQEFFPITKESGALKAIFIGRIHPVKNLSFLLAVLQKISGKVKLTLVGPVEDPGYWVNCQRIIDSFSSQISVELREGVSHSEVQVLIRQHHVLVSPTSGENFGHAILEALSNGRPVIISDQTPWRSLPDKMAGWDLAINNDQLFAKALQNVINMTDDVFQEWSHGAYAYARQCADNLEIKSKYKELFQ